ncbi:MAG: acyl-CoA reductase [Alphaproteobacteria bacterium]|nr:acyl-CoA reductase [Alphaproteobacteria bacterium]
MTHLVQLLPNTHETTIESITAQVEHARREPLTIGSEGALAFCAQLSDLLLHDKRAHTFPSLQALGFWLRPASVRTLVQTHLPCTPQSVRVPRGVVLQIPPSNIETLFGYNCALSLLCGNITVVRLPSESKPEQETLLDFIAEVLGNLDPSIARRLLFVRYGHDDAVTQGLSTLCDLRMVWGGDETISHIRTIPLPPLAHEISFANRFSMAALPADHFLAQDETIQTAIAKSLVNDVFQFNQMACASPRLLLWVGSEESTTKAASLFYPQLAAFALEKFGSPEPGDNMAKLNAQFLALHDLNVESKITYNPALTVLALKDWSGLDAFKALGFGNGMLLEQRLASLQDLAAHTSNKDQTLAFWGFDNQDIQAFISRCNGRGFDRIVRFGDALAFDTVWDGTNLFDVLTKFVKVSS